MRFHLAFVYFIWSILPHFHLLVHSHKGGEGFHVHLSFSAADVALANRTLDALGPAALNGDGTEFSLEGGQASVPSAGLAAVSTAFATSLKGSPQDGDKHSHYWEDANLAGMMSSLASALLASIAIVYFLRRHSAPMADLLGPAWARGPPIFLPA